MEGKTRGCFCPSKKQGGQLCRAEGHRGKERPAAKCGTETPRDAGGHVPARVVTDRPGCSRGSLEHRASQDNGAGARPGARASLLPPHPWLSEWTQRNWDRGKRVSPGTVWETWVGAGGRK